MKRYTSWQGRYFLPGEAGRRKPRPSDLQTGSNASVSGAAIDVGAPLVGALRWAGTRPAPTAPETEGLQPATDKETSRAKPTGTISKTLRSINLPSREDFTITCSKFRVLLKVYSWTRRTYRKTEPLLPHWPSHIQSTTITVAIFQRIFYSNPYPVSRKIFCLFSCT